MLVSNLYSVFLLKFTHYNGSLWMQRFTQYFEFSLLSFFYCVKQQNQDIKDKVDALSKEIAQLKEQVLIDWAITSGAEVTATSGNSSHNASNDETLSRSLQCRSDEYDDLSASNSDVVNQRNAEVTRVGSPIDEVQEQSYQLNNWPGTEKQ